MKHLLILLLFTLSAATQLPASERHALLIGIGSYKIKPLDGPPNDVAAIRSLLIHKYNYKPEFIHTLVDQQATKQGILQAMQKLVTEVKPGDYVFFLYSGHGTSFYDPNNTKKEAIGNTGDDTGASLPVDFDYSSLQSFSRTILLGREMRPYFTELDAKAQVFAIYDSCFSQDSMKALSLGTTKYVPISQIVEGASKGDLDDVEQQAATKTTDESNGPLPYKHLIAISAAKRDQPAIDISAAQLKRDPHATVDGKPHGQLTNAILMGLDGAADKNHDGSVSHEELFNYVNEVSAGKWRHNPKLRVSADSAAMLKEAAFDGKQITLDTTCQAAKTPTPRVSAPDELLREIGSGFVSVKDGWDIKAAPAVNGYLLYDTGGVQLNDKPMPRDQTVARLRYEPVLEQLSDLHYCQQKFNLALSSEPADLGKYIQGMPIQFFATVDHAAYVLVIDIDQEGGVTVVYPTVKASPLNAGEKTSLTQGLTVKDPFGVDLIKAFAFESKPDGFDQFVAAPKKEIYLHPGDPAMNALLQMLVKDAPDRSETRLQITTSSN